MNFTSSSGGCWLFGKPYQWLEGVDGQLELKPDVVQHTLFPLETKRRFDRYMGRQEKAQQLYRAYNSPEARMMAKSLKHLTRYALQASLYAKGETPTLGDYIQADIEFTTSWFRRMYG